MFFTLSQNGIKIRVGSCVKIFFLFFFDEEKLKKTFSSCLYFYAVQKDVITVKERIELRDTMWNVREKNCKIFPFLASGLVRGDHAEWKLLNSLLRYRKALLFLFQWNFYTHDEIIWWKITALFTLLLDFKIFFYLLHFLSLFLLIFKTQYLWGCLGMHCI